MRAFAWVLNLGVAYGLSSPLKAGFQKWLAPISVAIINWAKSYFVLVITTRSLFVASVDVYLPSVTKNLLTLKPTASSYTTILGFFRALNAIM